MGNKWKKISIICILLILGLVLVNIFYISPRLPEKKKIITKIWGCKVDDLECLKEKTNDEEIKLTSTDNRVEVEIPKNTLKKGAKLEIKPTKRPVEKEELPTLGTFGQVYEIKNKAKYLLNRVRLKFPYNEEEIPEGVKEEDLILARWDGKNWAPLASQVDTQNNLIIAERDKASSYSIAYAERPTLGGKTKRITVRGKFTIAGVGPLKRGRFSVSQEVNGKKEWIGILSKTNEKGEFYFSIPQKMAQKLNEGKLYIMAAANNDMVVIHDKGGKTYNTPPLKLEPVKGYEVTANVNQDSQDAFKIFHRYGQIRKSYLEMISNFKNEDLKREIKNALTNQVVVNYLLPATKGTQFTPHVTERDAIDIDVNNRNVGAMGDGDGDTEAHEYGHYMTRMLYGIFDYNRLVLSLKGKTHEIGDVTYQKLAFAEDMAYFLESVFDGKKMEDLDRANPYERKNQTRDLLYGRTGFATNFKDAIKIALENPSRVKDLERHLQVFFRHGNNALERLNKFIRQYNPALSETPKQIDGQGANILWDIYASEEFGQNKWERLEKIMALLADEEPKGLDDLLEALNDNFPGEKSQIEELFDKYAWRQEVSTMPEINWEELARKMLAETTRDKNLTTQDLNKIIEAINRTTGSGIKKECVPDWKCSEWSDCLDGWQTRKCEDLNKCKTDQGKPEEGRACEEDCIPDWKCSDWSDCVDNWQTCKCEDLNKCGTDEGKPEEGRACEPDCVPDWKCSDWSDCVDGWQTRKCEDLNKCGTDEGKPEEGRVCVPEEGKLTVTASGKDIAPGDIVAITIKIPEGFQPPFDINTSVSNGVVILPSRDRGHTVTGSFTSSNVGKASLYVTVTDTQGQKATGGVTFIVGDDIAKRAAEALKKAAKELGWSYHGEHLGEDPEKAKGWTAGNSAEIPVCKQALVVAVYYEGGLAVYKSTKEQIISSSAIRSIGKYWCEDDASLTIGVHGSADSNITYFFGDNYMVIAHQWGVGNSCASKGYIETFLKHFE